MGRYAFTIFLSAFLLFQVQPMIAKFILPWFGGSTLVWTTSMLFFQTALLLGYAYSHFVAMRMPPKYQWTLHTVLLGAALLFLPVEPNESLQPTSGHQPILGILKLLALSIGLPFVLSSTTGPLIQHWQSRTHPARSPYRLFALSNLGSLVALISYPFLIEPNLRLSVQSYLWSAGFILFVVMTLVSGWQYLMYQNDAENSEPAKPEEEPVPGESVTNEHPTLVEILTWVALAAAASTMLLATTNLMCLEIGSVPMLWVIPLSLYLLSFIICFERPSWYFGWIFSIFRRGDRNLDDKESAVGETRIESHQSGYARWFFYPLLFVSAVIGCLALHAGELAGFWIQVGAFSLICFSASMSCHGELSRMKPAAARLTQFYLMVSIGGALGGVFVALVAPRVFNDLYEFHVGLLATIVFCFLALFIAIIRRNPTLRWYHPINFLLGLVLFGFVIASFVVQLMHVRNEKIIFQARNPYGVMIIEDEGDRLELYNGRIMHGMQFIDGRPLGPTSYYSWTSGIGLGVQATRDFASDIFAGGDEGINIGVVGLGAGTMVVWGRAEDSVCFYEINPDIELIARNKFDYLRTAECDVSIVLGDARVQMHQQLKRGEVQNFDVLAIDAFTSDSIPMHLLTRECMELYWKHLRPDGVLAVHISNRFLDLEPVVYGVASELGYESLVVNASYNDESTNYNEGDESSSWILVTKNTAIIDHPLVRINVTPWPEDQRKVVWTDDFGSLFSIIYPDWWTGSKIETLEDLLDQFR